MHILTCASYYGTGSSAITDYITEFSTVKSLGEYEFRFLQDIDGISDLQYHLTENHNRHNSGHALKRYKKLVDFQAGNRIIHRYEPFFNNQWKKLSYAYIDSLTDFTFRGWWQYDLLDKGDAYYYWKLLSNKMFKMIFARNNEVVLNVLPNEITYCSHPTRDEFVEKTKKYLQNLMTAANPEKTPYLMVDQLVPPSEIYRYLPFFDDIHVVVVDRDPRDLYILEKYVWKGHVIPTETVELFCKWYRYTRAHRKTEIYDPEKVLLIQFEDLIYKYEDTTNKIRQWLELDEEHHTQKLQKFNPNKSIKNTQLWKKFDIGTDFGYIEANLKEYLYDYTGCEE